MPEPLTPDTIELLKSILGTLKQAKADRETANTLLCRCLEQVAPGDLQQDLARYLGDDTVAADEAAAEALIETLV